MIPFHPFWLAYFLKTVKKIPFHIGVNSLLYYSAAFASFFKLFRLPVRVGASPKTPCGWQGSLRGAILLIPSR
jgi:hypothetical protein